jgi:FAD-dependent monooxygenase
MPLTIQRSNDATVRRAYSAPLVLVRPDGHVAWRGDEHDAPADGVVAAVLDQVRGKVAGKMQ